MSRLNKCRKGCKDVFNAFLVEESNYAGVFEIPVIKPNYDIPRKLISFSKCKSSKACDMWVHFYEDDYLFERIWRNPKKYLPILKKYDGVILPDFSIYRDMPLVMQLWNIYRSRAIGIWLQENGIKVIPNIRYGDKRTYKCSTDGIPHKSVIAVGTHGTLKDKDDRCYFVNGLDWVVKRIRPVAIVVYGNAPNYIFDKYKKCGIEVYQFDSDYATSHKEVM